MPASESPVSNINKVERNNHRYNLRPRPGRPSMEDIPTTFVIETQGSDCEHRAAASERSHQHLTTMATHLSVVALANIYTSTLLFDFLYMKDV
jgi:hypothetical protein